MTRPKLRSLLPTGALLGLLWGAVIIPAVLSISVGLMNLFPIPLLDGGHLLFYALEAVRGKPLSQATQGAGFKIGLAIVGCLMVFAMWNDLSVMARWLDFAAQQIQSQ